MKDKLIVIAGPTAVGKTEISIKLATKFNGEIISGDSMQVYKGLNIGTAKIKPDDMNGITHHLIDIHLPDYNYSVAEFQEVAQRKIIEINKKNKLPIITGGTGLYIKSVTNKYNLPSFGRDEEYREMLYNTNSELLYNKLIEIDPITANRLHINDTKRIVRALEVHHLSGKSLSQILNEQEEESPYDLLMIGLTMNRAKLYERINKRVDIMINQGLVNEVNNLLELGYDEKHNSMQGIGYKEIIKYIRGEISLDYAIEIIKQNSRRYAKRQLSWFNQIPDIHWFDTTEYYENNNKKILETICHLVAGIL